MLVYIPYLGDTHAQRLARDVQNAGAVITTEAAAGIPVLIPLTPAALNEVRDLEIQLSQVIIPVLLAPCDVPESFQSGLIDLSTHYASGFPKLISRLASIESGANPYKGLHPYSELDAPRFFGRHGFLWKLHDHLTGGARCAVLTGPAGSGKTSLTSAGLVATLRESGQAWLPLQITLEDQPLHQMAAHLRPLITLSEDLVSILNSDAHTLGEILESAAPDGTRLAVVLDSFDNVFTRMPLSDRAYFLDALHLALTRSSPAYVTILVMRQELHARLIEAPKWAAALEGNVFPLPPVTHDEIIEIIRGPLDPANGTGLNITPGFAEHIAADVLKLNRPFLPDLSFLLSTLVRQGEMSEQAYSDLGGVAGALVNRAEAVIAPLNERQQLAVRRILCQLLDYTETGEPVARSMARDRFRFQWASESETQDAINRLLNEGLVQQTLEVETGGQFLRLSHVALAAEWPRFAGWLEADSESLRFGSHLERQAAVWAGREYAEQALLRGAKLDEALHWMQNPDYVPSMLLENFIAVSSALRQPAEPTIERPPDFAAAAAAKLAARQAAQQPQHPVRPTAPRWLIGLLVVLLAALLLSGLFVARIAGERDSLAATLQAIGAP